MEICKRCKYAPTCSAASESDFCQWAGTANCEECEHPVDDVSAADVAPVVHGRWEKNCDVAFFWKCSECGCYLFWRKEEYLLRNEDEPNYCPNCGARMDEVTE